MYAYIKGTLQEVLPDSVVLENNGIGYHIDVPGKVIDELPAKGAEVKLFTYLHVKEDCFSLFGFLRREELRLFRMMLNVSGIGPKGALGILTVLTPEALISAVSRGDAKAIARAPGVGSKTAQKLIIELKDKVSPEELLDAERFESASGAEAEPAGILAEAGEALTSLGYSAREAREVLSEIEITDEMSVEDVLKESLKRMAFL